MSGLLRTLAVSVYDRVATTSPPTAIPYPAVSNKRASSTNENAPHAPAGKDLPNARAQHKLRWAQCMHESARIQAELLPPVVPGHHSNSEMSPFFFTGFVPGEWECSAKGTPFMGPGSTTPWKRQQHWLVRKGHAAKHHGPMCMRA